MQYYCELGYSAAATAYTVAPVTVAAEYRQFGSSHSGTVLYGIYITSRRNPDVYQTSDGWNNKYIGHRGNLKPKTRVFDLLRA